MATHKGVMPMGYQKMIAEILTDMGRDDSPRHVEAWMRIEHPTLDGLSPLAFAHEVRIASDCARAAEVGESDSLADSMGL